LIEHIEWGPGVFYKRDDCNEKPRAARLLDLGDNSEDEMIVGDVCCGDAYKVKVRREQATTQTIRFVREEDGVVRTERHC